VVLESIMNLRIRASEKAKILASKYGYLPYMVERYIEILGLEGAIELLEANEHPLPDTIRCNDYLTSCNALIESLESKGFSVKPLHLAPHGLVVERKPISLGATLEYLQGYYYIQDPGSMLVAYELEPKPGDTILDMAAAPGGKATQILQLSMDRALLVAVDVSRNRIRALRSHLNRMRFKNYIIIRGDSRKINFKYKFYKILLDAPSTGEGIIRKDPSRKRSRTYDDVMVVATLQYQLLEAGLRYLADGGTLVYSACTLAPEEGEAVIAEILNKYNNIRIEKLNIPHQPGITEYFKIRFPEEVRNCGRLYPHIHGTEGFFICKLVKQK